MHGNRQRDAFGVPVVAAAITHRSYETPLPDGVHPVGSPFHFWGTVALARRMQPSAERILVFGGRAAIDGAWQRSAREPLADMPGIALDFESGRSLERLAKRAGALDARTLLLRL